MGVKKAAFSYYRSVVLFILIFIASTIPASEAQRFKIYNIPNMDKPVHLLMYFFFSFILLYDLSKAKPDFSKMKSIVIVSIIAAVYGGTMEILQALFTNYRSGDIFDFVWNLAGICLAVLLWNFLKRSK